MSIEAWMMHPDLIRYLGLVHVEWAGLKQLESSIVERPFDLDGNPHDLLRSAQQMRERLDFRALEARLLDQRSGHGLRGGFPTMHTADAMIFAPRCDMPERAL